MYIQVYIYCLNRLYVLYYIHTYMLVAHLGYGLCLLIVLTLMVTLLCVYLIYTIFVCLTYCKPTIFTSLFFHLKSPNAFCLLPILKVQILNLNMSIHGSILITFTMALHMNNDHIRYYHTDATVNGFCMELFLSPYLLGLQCWVNTTL